jgi:hypothetical protein
MCRIDERDFLVEIKTLTDAVGFVRKNPSMFMRFPERTADQLVGDLVFDAVVEGAKPVVVDIVGRWHVVGSPIDWLSTAGLSVGDVFSKLCAMPHVGRNVHRTEVVIAALSAAFRVYGNTGVELSGGQECDASDLDEYVRSRMNGWRVVAFLVSDKDS